MPLHVHLSGVAAGENRIQFLVVNREVLLFGQQKIDVVRHVGGLHAHIVRRGIQLGNAGNVVGIGAAAVIAHAIKHQDVLHSGAIGVLHSQNRHVLVIHRLRIFAGRGVTQHAASVQALPPDDGRAGGVVGAVEHVKLNARFAGDLRHGFRMAENVGLPGEADVVAEFLLAVFLPVEELPHQRFAVADVFIHLHPARGGGNEIAGPGFLLKSLENVRDKSAPSSQAPRPGLARRCSPDSGPSTGSGW